MSLKDIMLKKKDIILVDPRILKFMPGFNARNMEAPETITHIRKMANAMQENGVAGFPPITISQKDGETYVYAGHCRTQAALLAISEGSPLIGLWAIANNQTDEERVLDLLTSNDGLPLTQLEKAEVVKRLLKFEWKIADIAKKLGVTPKVVSDLISLTEAPAEIKEMVASNQISATLAVEVGKESPGNAVEILKDAVETAKDQGKTKATRQHIKTNVKEVEVKLKACPFCKCFLVLEEADRHRHPGDTCYLAGATVDDVEIELWNKRG